jgi:hypothetical protein
VVHVLVDCSKLRDLRQQLRSKIGDAINNTRAMLGGQTNDTQGKSKSRTLNREVLDAVLDVAEASYRFQARGEEAKAGDHRQLTGTQGRN